MTAPKFPRKSVRNSVSTHKENFTIANDHDLLENLDPRFQSFDLKDFGIKEPDFLNESTHILTKSDYQNQKSPNCAVCQKPFGIFSKPRFCKFCGNMVCHNDAHKKRLSPSIPLKPRRICVVCEDKYLEKRIHEEFMQRKGMLDKKMEKLRSDYVVYEEGLKGMQKNVFNMDFSKKKNNRDHTESISQKKLLLQKVKLSAADYDDKFKRHQGDLTNVNRKLAKLRNEIKDIDEKNHELKEQKLELDLKIKALDLDIDQTRCLIEENILNQRKSSISEKEAKATNFVDLLTVQVDKNEENAKGSNKKARETTETMLSEEFSGKQERENKSVGPVATYPVDEDVRRGKNYYECYACEIF